MPNVVAVPDFVCMPLLHGPRNARLACTCDRTLQAVDLGIPRERLVLCGATTLLLGRGRELV